MPQVAVPHSFFKKEKRDIYGRWEAALWRELIQNSCDAGAGTVDIRIQRLDNGNIEVVCADDGKGMDRETLENVFFRLGESTKDGEIGSTGGFGRARILTCFAQESYRIRTRDIAVKGQGADYEVEEGLERRNGCAFRIECDGTSFDRTSEAELRQELREYLEDSQLPAKVLVDGERFRNWCYKGKASRELRDENGEVFAAVHVNKSDSSRNNKMLIRVNGAKMFDRYIRSALSQGVDVGRVTVEIKPEKSLQVLTGSRDSMHYRYARVLDDFVSEIASDVKSALRERQSVKSVHVKRGKGLRKSGKAEAKESREADATGGATAPVRHDKEVYTNASASEREAAFLREGEASSRPLGTFQRFFAPELGLETGAGPDGSDAPDGSRWSGDYEDAIEDHDLVVHEETSNAAVRAAMKRYRPTEWTADGSSGANIQKLHAMWTAACQAAVDYLADRADTGISWTTGWVFDDAVEAVHKQVSDGDDVGHALLLNPVDDRGRMKYSLSSTRDMNDLIGKAAHEATHIFYGEHDQRYANLLTDVVCNLDQGGVRKAMKQTVSDLNDRFQKARERAKEVGAAPAARVEAVEMPDPEPVSGPRM